MSSYRIIEMSRATDCCGRRAACAGSGGEGTGQRFSFWRTETRHGSALLRSVSLQYFKTIV